MDEDLQKLLLLLDKAAEEMMSLGDQPTFSYFDTCADVGIYLLEIITKIKDGDLSEVSKLWYIFAPTGPWDDSHGSQEIANEIFEILNKNHKP